MTIRPIEEQGIARARAIPDIDAAHAAEAFTDGDPIDSQIVVGVGKFAAGLSEDA
jgi:hypothetical protein